MPANRQAVMAPAAELVESLNGVSLTDKPPANVLYHKNPIPQDSFEESVYKLIPVEEKIPEKQKMYKSKYADQARTDLKKNKKEAASMGKQKVQANEPEQFLRKGNGLSRLKPAQSYKKERIQLKAPVPKEKGVIPPKTTKDFIKVNALDNIHSIPKKTNLEESKFVEKKDFGKPPGYLVKRIQETEEEKQLKALEANEQKLMEQRRHELQSGVVPLPEEERIKILDGLKKNWEKLNNDYQKLSLTVDTVPKITRKVNMEQQLKQLEEQMAKFSHSHIFISLN